MVLDAYDGQMIPGEERDLNSLAFVLGRAQTNLAKLLFAKALLPKANLEADLLLDRASSLHRKQWSGQVQRAKCFLLKRAKTCSKAFLLFGRLVRAMSYL